ncbi:tetratricopeptide (TPR) repeat protein [Sporosarcina luteola]|nr:tetratricopeptide (TPR) repeat protein [Sporosarcina luteola]
MRIGHVIRAERARQEMKQIVLARGICTPSYLSKIERNLIEPSEEVVELLMERLGMDPTKFMEPAQDKTEQEFFKMLNDSYRNVIIKRDKDYTQQQLDLLLQENPIFENRSIYYTYLLIVLRFRLILEESLEDCKKEIDSLEAFSDDFDYKQKYYHTLNKALYYYSSGNIKMSLKHFEKSILLTDKDVNLEMWEQAELDYTLGVAYTVDERIFLSIDYIRKALSYFRDNFHMKRVLDCHILLGIIYKKTEQYQEAFDSYMKAKQICEDFDLHSEKGIIYHNLGSLNSVLGNRSEAVYYYHKSLESKSNNGNPLITIYCLVIEYSKSENIALVLEWVEKGLELYRDLQDKRFEPYYHHLSFFEFYHNGGPKNISIAENTIKYFKSLEDYRHVHKYCTALAEWYFKYRKYKLSSKYFREAAQYGFIYKKIEKWEDL